MQREVAGAAMLAIADQSNETADASAKGGTVAWLVAAALVQSAMVAIIVLLQKGQLWLLLPLHVVVVAALALHVLLLRRRRRETTYAMLGTLGVAAAGPLGAIGTLALIQLARRRRSETGLLAAWYDRIALSVAVDPVSRYCNNVSSGRTINLDAVAPPSYADVVASGSLAERQNVLGLIARRFHSDYLSILASALRSPEPVIRVQAAAVAAHVRPAIARMFRDAVAEIPAASISAVAALRLLRTFESMNGSGLLDESDRRQGVDVIDRLGDIVLARMSAGDDPVPWASSVEERMALEDTLERLFLRRGRYAQLRTSRSARRVLTSRRVARIRRMPASSAKARVSA